MPKTSPQKRVAQSEESHGAIDDLYGDALALYIEAMKTALHPKLEGVVRKWISKADDLDDADDEMAFAYAFILATDLEVFTPSLNGATSLDRLARRRKLAANEIDAFAALKRARFTPLRILSVQEQGFFAAEDLVSGAKLTVFEASVQSTAVGLTVVARLCPLSDGTLATVGPVTPIDDAGLAVVMEFVKPGKGITNEYRCAAAIYRHVVRHGSPLVPGLNRPVEGWDDVDDSEAGEFNLLDATAAFWHGLEEGEDPPDESVEAVRNMASTDNVMDALFCANDTRQRRGSEKLETAYRRCARLMMETLHRRAQAGSGHDPDPLETIARAIHDEIATEDYPQGAAAMFHAIRKEISAQARPKQSGDELTRVIERIRALRAKTIDQGCTESEAMGAANKVAELLDRYGLTLSEIDIKGQTCEGFGIESNRKRSGPLDECLPTVAQFCDCRAWHEKSAAGTIRSVFFGLPADVEAARYLYERVAAAFETETKAFQRTALYVAMVGGERRTATTSFQVGFARGIKAKLGSLKEDREAMFKTQSGRDLVPLKASVIEDDLAKLGLAFVSKASFRSRRIQVDAFEAGKVAGHQFEARDKLQG